jgi:hypothetical protein
MRMVLGEKAGETVWVVGVSVRLTVGHWLLARVWVPHPAGATGVEKIGVFDVDEMLHTRQLPSDVCTT